MKVLLMTTDLYRAVGGSQSVYRKIIDATPDVEFTYFRDSEAEDVVRPANAKAVPLGAGWALKVLTPPPYPTFRYIQLEEANRYAQAVAGMSFDIVDTPDFQTFGAVLRSAFAHHNVTIGRIVLAMHGNMSVSMDIAWGLDGNRTLDQRQLEQEQYMDADGLYAISQRYIKQWQKFAERPIHYIDPLNFVDIDDSDWKLDPASTATPNLYCIGRMEKRKGNDLFVELVRWLNPGLYNQAAHIGEADRTNPNADSSKMLNDIAKVRGLSVNILPSYSRKQLQHLFQERSLVILPVHYDTLNLVALEAVMAGCPVAVSSEAGICDYFDQAFPGLPYIKIDFKNFYSAVKPLTDLLVNYDERRKALSDYLQQHRPTNAKPNMRSLYESMLQAPENSASPLHRLIPYTVEHSKLRKKRLRRLARAVLPKPLHARAKRFVAAIPGFFGPSSRYYHSIRFIRFILRSAIAPRRLTQISALIEYNTELLRNKLHTLYLATQPFCRCNFWLDIARIERLRGNDVIAVAYELRALRLLGKDPSGLLPKVITTLRDKGFEFEALAAEAMYGDPANANDKVYAFLHDANQRNKSKPELPLEKLEDHRGGTPKVAVIVSLYNAAPKLKVFLTCLMQQTLVKQDQAEIILVDSGSPDREYEEIQNFIAKTPLNMVYARSSGRETIQAAWNRGIKLAKAPYLVFLGVDETLYPEALSILAYELDRNPTIDWVMADSLVTDVDENGVLKKDVMTYNRTGATKDHTYLETCYLSWVGGMYRKSIHERFGYYDETFGAAGDTEFKNRVMPSINVKFIPKPLGLFLNYPDERTTASPRAEIEDLRAWYIHRTPSGVRYAFENRPNEDAAQLFYTALGYRKSYCCHTSSDIDYACYLAEYLASKQAPGSWDDAADELNSLRQTLIGLEYTPEPLSFKNGIKKLYNAWYQARTMQNHHQQKWAGRANPTYKVFNDNRYEQHSWLWKSK